ATAPSTFEITKQATNLVFESLQVEATEDGASLVALLTDAAGKRLVEQTVVFVIRVNGTEYTRAVITNLVGQASLTNVLLPAGTHQVTVQFAGTNTYAA